MLVIIDWVVVLCVWCYWCRFLILISSLVWYILVWSIMNVGVVGRVVSCVVIVFRLLVLCM